MKKKTIAMLMASIMLFGVVTGSTLAWLTAKSADVVNTFTVGDINIVLDEAPLNEKGELDKTASRVTSIDDYKMIPGVTLPKDPQVRVLADSEDCYLFVKITESSNYDDFMTYEVMAEWTLLKEENNSAIYYREAKANDAFYVLKDNQVVVKDEVTKAQLDALDGLNDKGEADQAEEKARPTLTFTAYAIQKNNLKTSDMNEIWTLASAN